MEKQLVFILFYFLVCQNAFSQMFQTTLRFTDAIGNQDSIVVGFDTTASEGIDPQFGEVELLSPFDSIFEVRAGSSFWPEDGLLSKKIIGSTEKIWGDPTGCYDAARTLIYVWAKHQPITVKWNIEAIKTNPCVDGSVISNHQLDRVSFPHDWEMFPQNIYRCMMRVDSLTINLSAETIITTNVIYPVEIEKPVEGLGEKTIYGLSFSSDPLPFWNNPCNRYVGLDEPSEKAKLRVGFNVYPNPATDAVTIELAAPLSQPATLEFYNQLGEKVLEKHFPKGQSEATVLVSHLPKGLYFLSLLENGHVVITRKVVVQ